MPSYIKIMCCKSKVSTRSECFRFLYSFYIFIAFTKPTLSIFKRDTYKCLLSFLQAWFLILNGAVSLVPTFYCRKCPPILLRSFLFFLWSLSCIWDGQKQTGHWFFLTFDFYPWCRSIACLSLVWKRWSVGSALGQDSEPYLTLGWMQGSRAHISLWMWDCDCKALRALKQGRKGVAWYCGSPVNV